MSLSPLRDALRRLASNARSSHRTVMDLDELLQHYFAASDPAALDEGQLDRARERIAIDFGTERDPGRRFALWTLLHALGAAPDPSTAFKAPAERKAAEDYAWTADRMGRR